ncbi:MAG: PH domain-containing protein [Sedimentisphaerales bacterium]|nr:PH domain-containing protein [Sedimentisphaerales bacterium]
MSSSDEIQNTKAAGETAESSDYQSNIDKLLPGDLLADDETVIFAIKPSLWTVLFLSFRVVVIAVVVIITAITASKLFDTEGREIYIVEAAGTFAVARVAFALLQWFSRTYVLTNRRVIRIRGVFTIDIFQCSLLHIQNTFLVMSFWQRILNLGNIALTTAGTGRVEAVWRHCKTPLKVHQQLLRAINRASNPTNSETTTPTD